MGLIFFNDIDSGWGFSVGGIIGLLVLVYMFLRAGHPPKIKNSSNDLTTSLTCTSQTSIFSSPANKRYALSALNNGLNITLLSKPKATYFLKYSQLLKFYFEEGNSSEPGQTTQQNLPDYIYIEYKGDDGLINQFRFSQTKKDKIHNQRVNEQKNIIILVNSHMSKK